MGWKRLPTLLAHIPLRPLPLSEQRQKLLQETGHLPELAFKTVPRVGKASLGPILPDQAAPLQEPAEQAGSACGHTSKCAHLRHPCTAAARGQALPGARVRAGRGARAHRQL